MAAILAIFVDTLWNTIIHNSSFDKPIASHSNTSWNIWICFQDYFSLLWESLLCFAFIKAFCRSIYQDLKLCIYHYSDVIMGGMASQITSLTIVYSTVYSSTDQRKHQSSASLAFVGGIHQWPVKSPHKGPVTRKMLPFDDVIMVFPSLHPLLRMVGFYSVWRGKLDTFTHMWLLVMMVVNDVSVGILLVVVLATTPPPPPSLSSLRQYSPMHYFQLYWHFFNGLLPVQC